jgi:hypothetical protein
MQSDGSNLDGSISVAMKSSSDIGTPVVRDAPRRIGAAWGTSRRDAAHNHQVCLVAATGDRRPRSAAHLRC